MDIPLKNIHDMNSNISSVILGLEMLEQGKLGDSKEQKEVLNLIMEKMIDLSSEWEKIKKYTRLQILSE